MDVFGGFRTVQVTHPKAAAAAKPTTAAKPAPAQPAAAQPAVAEPAPAQAAGAKAVAAPVIPAAPATGAPAAAPAGTTELAQTGADTPTGFLAAASAAVLALGAGVMIAVRRLRPQR
ncbi:LAETG motif-containing sortase-dependent surface protein [Kitasatospora sp. A2-31]|uniref:LAETG motif-containing sortase-dependent surface protein n=1 Tax=Kitasatospora sp. A2-31 TaxID=2916414 RepID=UPI001EEBF268|nr:LAETG motif-containing sortase-dependent surface protein [Kitasatospora sp. A2-31]MCG6494610.1 LPXTG cell wall anchor domain-containing protein [Kitasatospora sp. A2-31]